MDEAIDEGFDVLDALDIPDDVLSRYDQPSEEDSDRPVYIDPGVYRGQLIEWGKVYNPMFKKYSLEMTFALGNERLKGWFNIEKSNSDTLLKQGGNQTFLGCIKKSLMSVLSGGTGWLPITLWANPLH